MEWSEHQAWERSWWADCTNTFAEEAKQLSYAHRMGLTVINDQTGRWPVYDLAGKSVLDIGAGPVSMLLKTINGRDLTVVDPCEFPDWVYVRYEAAQIAASPARGEDLKDWWFDDKLGLGMFDEVWIYNCLQHTEDPETIITNVRHLGKMIRVFEWVDIPTSVGHPQVLKAPLLDQWFGDTGTLEQMDGENGCNGMAYYGVF